MIHANQIGGIDIQLMIVEGCYESEQVAVVGVLNMLIYGPIQHNSTIKLKIQQRNWHFVTAH